MKRGPSIAVVGTGGVGGYLGGRLAAAGHDVRFLARGENLAALKRSGLRVTSATSGCAVTDLKASNVPEEIGQVDFVLLCVKTWQLPAAIEALSPLVGQDTAVVTIQNGVEAPEQVAAGIGRDRVLPGMIRVVATLAGPGEVKHMGPPAALAFAEWDGSVSARVARLRDVLREASLTATEQSGVWAEIWAKFLLVAPIGSLGAATGGANLGELRSRPGIRKMLITAMREIFETAIALGIALPTDAVDTAVGIMDRQPSELTTSLQRDILAGQPSELEAWTGAAVRLASRAGRTSPVNELLYELLASRATRSANHV